VDEDIGICWYRICKYTNVAATIARYGRKRFDELEGRRREGSAESGRVEGVGYKG